MSEAPTSTPANPATGAEPAQRKAPQSFRERKAAQLNRENEARERDERQPEPPEARPEPSPATGNDSDTLFDPPRETLEEAAEESLADQPKPADDQEAIDDDPDDDYDDEPDDEPASQDIKRLREQVAELTEARDKAEGDRKNFEKDYRRKTHKHGQAVRENEAVREKLKSIAQFQVQQSETELQQFGAVNWQQVQAADPGQYEQLRTAYQQAATRAQHARGQQEALAAEVAKQRAQESKYRSDVSREILSREIPGWGPDVYNALSKFAEKTYDITPDEFAKIEDWRTIKPIFDAFSGKKVKEKSADVVNKIGRKRGKPPAGKTAKGQTRNAAGRYAEAAKTARARPGDRAAFRAMKAAQLAAEAKRRR